MLQKHAKRLSCRTLTLISAAFLTAGCLPQGEADTPDENNDEPSLTQDHQLVGSVGDGPIVNARILVKADDGTDLGSTTSTSTADYDVTVKTRGFNYPLRLLASEGTDLVTQNQPDFTLKSLVVNPGNKTVSNLNPFTAIAYETAADMSGGLDETTVANALDIVSSQVNCGLSTLRGVDVMTSEIDSSNVTDVLRASEGLGEIVRRVRDHMQSAGYGATGDDIVAAVGSDLVDGVLDGRGGPRTNARISALAGLARAQIGLETMQNLLRVQGSDAMVRLNNVLAEVFAGTPSATFDELPLTTEMHDDARVGLLAVDTLQPSAEAQSLLAELDTVSAGMLPPAVRQALSGDGRTLFASAMQAVAGGTSADIETVNSVLRSGTAPSQNSPPVITGSPATSVGVGSAYDFQPTASDSDGDPLTFSIAGRPSWAAFDQATGALTGTPESADVGSYSGITISVSDGQDASSLPAFTITVQSSGNTPPEISGTPASSVLVGQSYSFTPQASDADGDSLTFSVTNLPTWASFDASTGTLGGTPGSGDVGTYGNISITVTDGEASSTLGPFSISVDTVSNTAPVISGTPPATVTEGSAYSFTPTASDADGDSLTFSIANRPSWASFATSTGTLSGTPATGDAGTYGSISITVTDGTDSATLGPFTITVEAQPNTAPVIGGTPPATVTEGSAYSFTPTASDADGDSLTFSIANRPSWASFATSTGTLSGTPTAGDIGTYADVTITVSDGQESASLGPFSISVEAIVTGSATLSWTPPTENTDGTALTDLAGYRIYWGTSPGNYTESVQLDNPGLTSYVVENLSAGTWYFVSTAINSAGVESNYSNEAAKTIQ